MSCAAERLAAERAEQARLAAEEQKRQELISQQLAHEAEQLAHDR